MPLRPLPQFLRRLLLVGPQLTQKAVVNLVLVNDLEVIPPPDAFHLMHQEAGLAAGDALHLRVGCPLLDPLLHAAPPVV